jgi:membrane-associated phospholipid phosphatase
MPNIVPAMHAAAPPAEPGARRSLRALLRAGPAGRAIARADLRLYRLVRTAARPPAVDVVGRFSSLGEHAALWLVIGAAGMALDGRRRDRWRRATLTVGGTYLLNTAIKGVFRRRRPALEDLPALIATPTALSFPSAHASTSFAAASSLSEALPSPPLYLTALAMALSRPYMGVHYPSDSLAGAALGALVAREVRRAHRTLDER